MGKRINDEFTNLPVSRQRKHQLRNPAWSKAVKERYLASEKGKRGEQRRHREYYERNIEWKQQYYRQYYIKKRLDE